MLSYYVYLIVTKKNNKIISYVGYTSNIIKRIIDHNLSKGAKATRGKQWEYAYLKKYNSKSDAMRGEFKLKKNYKLRNKIKSNFFKNE